LSYVCSDNNICQKKNEAVARSITETAAAPPPPRRQARGRGAPAGGEREEVRVRGLSVLYIPPRTPPSLRHASEM